MSDFPFEECADKAGELLGKGGAQVLQKFTCAGCGQRLTIEEPNMFFTHGSCDKCPAITDIKAQGCNYMLHLHHTFQPTKLTICVTPGSEPVK